MVFAVQDKENVRYFENGRTMAKQAPPLVRALRTQEACVFGDTLFFFLQCLEFGEKCFFLVRSATVRIPEAVSARASDTSLCTSIGAVALVAVRTGREAA